MHAETYAAKERGFRQSKVNVSLLLSSCFSRHSPGLNVSLATRRQLMTEFPWRLRTTKVKNTSGQLDMEESPSLQLTYQLVPASHRALSYKVYFGAVPL